MTLFDSMQSTSALFSNSESAELNIPEISSLQFLNRADLLLKVSQAVFDDFYQNTAEFVYSEPKDEIGFVGKLFQTSDYAVKSLDGVNENESSDANLKQNIFQLRMERAAYDLIMRTFKSNKHFAPDWSSETNSILEKLSNDDKRFRQVLHLLRMSEESGVTYPTDFSRICDDAYKLNNLDNIYACSKIRGSIHLDSRFTDRIAAEDEEAVNILNRVLFSLLRTGRLSEAKGLFQGLSLPALSTIIIMREFLTNASLSPINKFDENYNLAKSRIFFKQTAQKLIPIDDERIQGADQCIWGTVSGSLPTLLTHANNIEDRLWAYLSCAAEFILDMALLDVHGKQNDDLNAIKLILERTTMDLPLDVASIFKELRNFESNPYYEILGKIAVEDWNGAIGVIANRLEEAKQSVDKDELPPHELRFYAHLILFIYKLTNESDNRIFDKVLLRFIDLLIRMHLYAIVPFYLHQLFDKRIAKNKMIDFLEGIRNESEQRTVLDRASDAGFDTSDLCRSVFERFKNKHPLRRGDGADQLSKSAYELINAWRWLNQSGVETIWDALFEANYILRKLFIYQRMSEAVELISFAPDNLPTMAIDCFRGEFPGEKLPEKLEDGKKEYDCYVLYFEAINKYNMWQRHVEGQSPPKLPQKLSDENWARMDIRMRAEYDLSVQKAKDCLQKYMNIMEMLKSAAIESLEKLLKCSDGWLVTLSVDEQSDSNEAIDPQVFERAQDYTELRRHYFFHVMKLLIDIHSKSNAPMKVLELSSLLVDPRYNIHKALSDDLLRQLTALISKSGAALL